jgi:predicted PurR-regulated permease PerM
MRQIASLPGARVERAGGDGARTAALVVVAAILAIAALREGRIFAAPTVIAGLVALALAPAARLIERLGVGRGLAAFALVFGTAAAVGVGVYLLAPAAQTLEDSAGDILRRLERAALRLEREVGEALPEQLSPAPDPAAAPSEDGALVASGRALLTDMALAAPALLGALAYGVFLAFFLLAERERIPRAVLACAGGRGAGLRFARAMRAVQKNVTRYLFAITIINIALGALAAAAFWALGAPSPALWGAAMAALNFMPYVGPALMAVAVLAVGLVTFPSPEIALACAGVVVLLNTVEGYLVTPTIVGRQVQVGALAVFMAVAFGAWLWGAAGALIATPALIVAQAFLRHVVGGARRYGRAPASRPVRAATRNVARPDGVAGAG